MPFQVGVTKASLTGPPPVPTGLYKLRVVRFRPKIAKSGNSMNYNLEAEVVEHSEALDGRKVFHPLNTSFGIAIWDFVHACGLEMDVQTVPVDGVDGEEEEIYTLPGIFEGASDHPDDPEQWGDYKGPLTNRVFAADVVETSYNGKPKNEVRAFLCALPDCAEKHPGMKHSTNLIKS